MQYSGSLSDLEEVKEAELACIAKRRQHLGTELTKCSLSERSDLLSLALSGGGIRSATFNLGILQAINKKRLLERVDYISSVSGGGYIHSFVQERLHRGVGYNALFESAEIERLKSYGDYLRPHSGMRKFFESVTFYVTYAVLAILHLLWYILFFASVVLAGLLFFALLPKVSVFYLNMVCMLILGAGVWYYFFHVLRHVDRRLWNEGIIYYLFAALILIFILIYLNRANIQILPQYMRIYADGATLLVLVGAVVLLGYFSNPNILSMHRYYRIKISDAYLRDSNIKVYDLIKDGKMNAPYPLICSTLNIQSDSSIAGMSGCDYYLFSPLYSGSKLTKYVETGSSLYQRMTLATATTVSGAALNSLMGYKSNRFISFILTLLNVRLGYWAINPKILEPKKMIDSVAAWLLSDGFKVLPTFWPWYNLAELFGKMNLDRWMLNLSDGGGIENLAAYEMFRRKAAVIICSDAGADPKYTFDDLKNLLLRVRNELEIKVEFSGGQRVEELISPKPSSGYSKKHYVVGKYYELPEKGAKKSKFLGYFVYIKASVTAPEFELKDITRGEAYYAYKNHHPDFPHESTVDQFFDSKQWEAYRTLGEEIGDQLLEEIGEQANINELEYALEKMIG